MSTKINIVLIIFISLIFGIFNFKVFFIGNEPNLIQAYVSVSFIIIWLLYSFTMSYKKAEYFFRFITLYWAIGLILTFIALFLGWFILIIPLSCIFLTPLYGLRYFLNEPISSNFFYLAIFITYLSGTFGYFLGKIVRCSK
ncbi:MAG TPA: hypothetical protein VIK86_06335 [Candidatus Paceibacterota bacterium]